ncbi:MAG: preprotein translocase subunit YajC [Planctomycetota bacterium]
MHNSFDNWLQPTLAFQEEAAPGPVVVPGVAPVEGEASEGAAADPSATGAPPPGGGFPSWMLPVMGAFLVFMIWSSSSAQKKEKKKKEALMSSLTKQDKVQTIGGVIGTIIELQDDSIVLRVDDTSNTRIRFARSAIQQVLTESHLRKDAAVEVPTIEAKNEPATV